MNKNISRPMSLNNKIHEVVEVAPYFMLRRESSKYIAYKNALHILQIPILQLLILPKRTLQFN